MKDLIRSLEANHFSVHLANNKDEARKIALGLIPSGASVGMGNSLTLRETGIFEALTSGQFQTINQFETGLSPEENLRRRKASMVADVYFTSTNALTMDGAMINVDGKGNRVAAMMFGPDRVVVVVGRNKIVADENAAWEKMRQSIAPTLAKRLGRSTPCASTGVCSDCQSPQRICRCYTVIRSQMPADKDRIHIVLVDEDLGI
ncbi:MAG: lactate utilization protein [Bacillota bacterium]